MLQSMISVRDERKMGIWGTGICRAAAFWLLAQTQNTLSCGWEGPLSKRKEWEARFSEVLHIPWSPQELDVVSIMAVKPSCLLSSPSPLTKDSLRPWECTSRSCKPQEICQSLSFPDTATTFHVPQRNYLVHPLPGWAHRRAHFPQKISFPLK